MLSAFVLVAVASSAIAGYSGTGNTNDNKVTGGYGYGYSGSFSGDGIPPNFPQFPQFDFQNFLQQYVGSLRKYHEDLVGNLGQLPGAYSGYGFQGSGIPAYAFQGQQHYSGGGVGGVGGVSGGGGRGGGGGGGGEGAAASAFIGPGGVHQTAAVFPENPNSPNINTRFASEGGGGGGGFHSVSTSSFSSSSDVNGKPTSFHQATTTVNDNGKVTTYTVKKP